MLWITNWNTTMDLANLNAFIAIAETGSFSDEPGRVTIMNTGWPNGSRLGVCANSPPPLMKGMYAL